MGAIFGIEALATNGGHHRTCKVNVEFTLQK